MVEVSQMFYSVYILSRYHQIHDVPYSGSYVTTQLIPLECNVFVCAKHVYMVCNELVTDD